MNIDTMVRFSGINNRDDAMRISLEQDNKYEDIYPLCQAYNVDIDDTYMISSRKGKVSLLQGTDIHSLWSNGNKCFFVDGINLYQLMDDFSVLALRTVTRGARVRFVEFNDKIYYTNGHECGYVKDYTAHALADPCLNFKMSLPHGQLIEVFMGCIYMAVDNILYVTDPLCDYFDIRTGYMIFKDKIKMVCGVENGIYVADSKTWFLSGKGNDDFERTLVTDSSVVMYTDVKIDGSDISESSNGIGAIWTGDDGICFGDGNGKVRNESSDRYILSPHEQGAAYIREVGQVKHYVNSIF